MTNKSKLKLYKLDNIAVYAVPLNPSSKIALELGYTETRKLLNRIILYA